MGSGAWDLYDALLRHPLTNPNAPDERDQGILHALVGEGPLDRIAEVVDTLLDADVNLQDCDGYTPLHIATYRGRADVVRKLLNVPGIRLDLPDKQGRTPLTLATYWGMKSIALVLIEHSQAFPLPEDADMLSPLVLAAKHGHKDLCRQLLERARYRNLDFHIDLSGRGILHHSAINNWADVLADCISRGVSSGGELNINKLDHAGKTALHHAVALGNVDACLVLVNAGGASLTLQDRNGRTAAQAAADAGFKDALVALLRSGRVDPNQRDVDGRNLVHWAATLDCVDVMELVESTSTGQGGGAGVEWARRDKHGKRPVAIAGMCGSKNVGLFLAARTPGWRGDRPDWRFDLMYRSETVEAVEDDDELQRGETLEARIARREKQRSDEEWEEFHRRFPDSRYGLVYNGPPKPNTAAEYEARLRREWREPFLAH
jgi:ankyrin repeat protein